MSNTETTQDRDLDAATSQLSTAPKDELTGGTSVPGSFGGVRRPGLLGGAAWLGREISGWARWFWRQLTSMRVALILLFLLSLAAIPGSLVPQADKNPTEVEDFHKAHDVLAPIYDALQLFHVYTSVWFSAIYILLFTSLAGCIIPRSWQFVGQLRARPPRAPRRMDRMPAYTTWRTEADAEEVLTAARGLLGKKRYRVEGGTSSLAAEKGYLREAGNLMFHIALIVLLLAFAAGQLWRSEGGALVIQGKQGGFANTLSQYDDFSHGSLFDTGDLEPFSFLLDDFHAKYAESGPNKGTPRVYKADITYKESPDDQKKQTSIEVNDPLQVGDTKVYLIAHGFAPVVTVTDGQGNTAYHGPVAFLPQDKNLTSVGVVKAPDAFGKNGKVDQLAFQGFFVPTFGGATMKGMRSQSPQLDYPVLLLTAYHGDLGLDSGVPQNVYQLDTEHMKQFKADNGDPFKQMLRPGETMKLPDGAGSLKFEGIKQWANFQINHSVGAGWALGGALAAIFGLAGSLFIQRRRVWVRAVTGDDGRTTVEMAGLGRSESARLPHELGDLAARLQPHAPPAPEPGDGATDPSEAEPAHPVAADEGEAR
ncbi:MAG TPA: cytochrome c biogenesis protein ResB [Streptomyces sp.]|nr:cytochrome c biogenesis protein ResB [Streptomyces sp.]